MEEKSMTHTKEQIMIAELIECIESNHLNTWDIIDLLERARELL